MCPGGASGSTPWSIEDADPDLVERVQAAEEAIYHDSDDPLVNWDVANLESALRAGGLEPQQVHVERHEEQRQLTADHLGRWFEVEQGRAARPSYAARLQAGGVTSAELQDVTVPWSSAIVYVVAAPAERPDGERDDAKS